MQEIKIQGWKGKGDIKILSGLNTFRIIEYRKSKETEEIYEDERDLPFDNVYVLWGLIKKKCDMETKYGYKYLVRLVLNHYKFHEKENIHLDFMMEAFNGGKNRAKYYFPYLYYPLKVLEYQGKIKYFGRGGIQRLE